MQLSVAAQSSGNLLGLKNLLQVNLSLKKVEV